MDDVSHLTDEALGRAIGVYFDQAALPVDAGLIADRAIERGRPVGPSVGLGRLVMAVGLAALLLLAGYQAVRFVGSILERSELPPIESEATASAAPSGSAAPRQGGIRAGAMADVCAMQFQRPLQDVLDIVVRAEHLTPPDAVPNSVCELYDVAIGEPSPVQGPVVITGGSSPAGFVGNIHVFEPPAENVLEARIEAIFPGSSPPSRYDLGGTPVLLPRCGGSTCSSPVFIADDRYLVMVLIDPDYLPGTDDLETLLKVAQAVIDALAAGEVGVPGP